MFQDTAFGWKSLGEDVVSLIVSEVYDALIEAGTSEEKARAAAGAIPVAERLATRDDIFVLKDDMAALKDEIRNDMAVLRNDIAVFKDEIRNDMAVLRNDMAVFKDEIRNDMAVLRNDIAAIQNDMVVFRHDLASLKLVVFSSVPALLGLLVKLVFFP